MKTTLTVLVAFVALCVLHAQDMTAGKTAAEQAGAVDQGQKIAEQAVDKAPELAQQPSANFISAEMQVKNALFKLGLTKGFNKSKGAIIQIGVAEIAMNDPANDDNFFALRSAKALEAYLMAKSEIIKSLFTDFSAIDRLMMLEDGDLDKNEKERKERVTALQEKQQLLARKFSQLDKAEADALAGVTFSERLGATLDGLTKKLDSTYSIDKIKADKRALRDQLLKDCNALKAEIKALESELNAAPTPTVENESTIKLLSKMPLLGSSVLTQAESWDENDHVYSIAMAVVWSPQMQEEALALYHNIKRGNKGKYTPQEWVRRMDLATMVGPRRFRDTEGHTIFVGISAVSLNGPVSKRNIKRMLADTDAKKYVAFSLIGDVETYREVKTNFKEYDDDDRSISQNFVNKVMQKCEIALQGCTQLHSIEFIHPISKQKAYAVAYYIDTDLAQNAQEMLKQAYAGASIQEKTIQYRRGLNDGMQQELDKQRESQTDYNRGKAEAGQQLRQETQKQANLLEQNQNKPSVSTGAAGSKSDNGPRKSQGGTFSGDTEIDTNF